MKRTYIRTLFYSGLLALCCLGTASCEDYLDKAPESSVNPNDAFKNFRNFQGFTEELYYCIPDFAHGYWNNSFNWGEDELISFSIDYHMGYKVDMGDFWGWQSEHDGRGSVVGWTAVIRKPIRRTVYRNLFGLWRGMASVRLTWAWRIWISRWKPQTNNVISLWGSFTSSVLGFILN